MAKVKQDTKTQDLFATARAELIPCELGSVKGLFKLDADSDEVFMQIIPAKFMMNSTMIYEIQTRGDVFAVSLKTNIFTTFKGNTPIIKLDGELCYSVQKENNNG